MNRPYGVACSMCKRTLHIGETYLEVSSELAQIPLSICSICLNDEQIRRSIAQPALKTQRLGENRKDKI